MRHLGLFSGIGGWELAARWTWQHEHELLGFVERDKYCQKILNKNFPGVLIIGEIAECDGTKFESVELITGSPPCQPFSVAGKRKGKEDDRHLWPEMFRVIREAKPRWVCVENVVGLAGMVLDEMLDDLEGAAFEAEPFIIPACGVGANHRRDRIWIVAHNTNGGNRHEGEIGRVEKRKDTESAGVRGTMADTTSGFDRRHHPRKSERQVQQSRIGIGETDVSDTNRTASKEQWVGIATSQELASVRCGGWWETEPAVGRVVNGLPHRVDRLRGLGNAIVPQVAREILEAIKQTEAVLCE